MTIAAPEPPIQVPVINPVRQSRTSSNGGGFGDSRGVANSRQSMYSSGKDSGSGISQFAPPWLNYFGQVATSAYNPILNIPPGSIDSAMLNIAAQGWTQTCAFSATDTDTVSWGAGTFTAANGNSYAIGAGNTGNMAVKTYIYFDITTSTVSYQLTTNPVTAIGDGKVFIAVAQPHATESIFTVFNNDNANIDANNIVANTLSVISADLGTITAGNITLPSGGFIRSGQSAYDTGTGFYLGNDSGTPKFSIGNSAADKLTWDGSTLAITGNIVAADITGGTIIGSSFMTAGSGNNRVTIDATDGLQLIDSSNVTQVYLNASTYAGIRVNGLRSKDTNSIFMESQSQNVQFFVDQASARASFTITGATRAYFDDQDTSGGGNLSTSGVLRTNGALKRVACQQGTGPGFGYLYLV